MGLLSFPTVWIFQKKWPLCVSAVIFWLQSLVAHIDLLELPLNALKENATELEQIISESSKAVTSHSVSSLWQRWTRLRSVARAQERALEDNAREWRNFTEKVREDAFVVDVVWVLCCVGVCCACRSTHCECGEYASIRNMYSVTPTTLYPHDTFSLHSSLEKMLLLLQIWVKYRNSWIPVGVLWYNSRLQASCFFLPKHCVMKRFPAFRPISSVNAVSSQELPQSTALKKENRSNCKKWWSLPHMWHIPCCPLVFYGPFVLQDMMSFSALESL